MSLPFVMTGIVNSSAFHGWFPADQTSRIIAVLFLDDRGDVGGRQAQPRHHQRIQNDPHAVVLLAKDHRIADTFQAVDKGNQVAQ